MKKHTVGRFLFWTIFLSVVVYVLVALGIVPFFKITAKITDFHNMSAISKSVKSP